MPIQDLWVHTQFALDREQRAELLALADPTAIVDLAERALALSEIRDRLVVIQPAETGLVMLQVREPVCSERFHLGEVVVTRAEVAVGEAHGWSMRLGGDGHAALGAAICDAVAELVAAAGSSGSVTTGTVGVALEVDELCRRTRDQGEAARHREWDELAPTVVQFEELD